MASSARTGPGDARHCDGERGDLEAIDIKAVSRYERKLEKDAGTVCRFIAASENLLCLVDIVTVLTRLGAGRAVERSCNALREACTRR